MFLTKVVLKLHFLREMPTVKEKERTYTLPGFYSKGECNVLEETLSSWLFIL